VARYAVVAVGRLKDGFFEDAAAEYVKRLSAFGGVEMTEIPEASAGRGGEGEIERAKAREGAGILAALPRGAVVALDSRGDNLTSEAFAAKIADLCAKTAHVTFIIGGPHGLSEAVRARADLTVAFGKATFPHRLVRVMLLEQVYRAGTITEGRAYHK
jgi:23S rRNA (pseudouridine1915-N3)-methyltransferase